MLPVLRPATMRDGLRDRLRGGGRILIKELAAFGVIGALAFVMDLAIFTWLTQSEDLGALKSKAVSTIVSTTFAYFGNKYLSFSHRARTSIGRETSFFFGINLVTLAFSEAVIGFFVYALGYGHASTMVFVVNVATIGVGTIFRFWAYKRFVFLHPDRVNAADVDLDEELSE
jgi:putative flippase GtrA